MNIEQIKKIVECAPKDATDIDHTNAYWKEESPPNEIAKHDTLDLEPSDIPHDCVVVEK